MTFLMETSISSQEAPEMSVRPTLPGRMRSPTIWSDPTTNVTDVGPLYVLGVHVNRGSRLLPYLIQGAYVIAVAVGDEDGGDGPLEAGQYLLRLGPRVHDHVVFRGV